MFLTEIYWRETFREAKQLRKRVAAALRRAADAQHAILDMEIAQLCKADGAEQQQTLQRHSSRRWRIAQELETLLEQVKSTLLRDSNAGSDADEQRGMCVVTVWPN